MPRRKQTSPIEGADPVVLGYITRAMEALKEPSVNELEEWISLHVNVAIPKGSVKDTLKKGVETGSLIKIKSLFKQGYPCYKLASSNRNAPQNDPAGTSSSSGSEDESTPAKGCTSSKHGNNNNKKRINRIRKYRKQETIHATARN